MNGSAKEKFSMTVTGPFVLNQSSSTNLKDAKSSAGVKQNDPKKIKQLKLKKDVGSLPKPPLHKKNNLLD